MPTRRRPAVPLLPAGVAAHSAWLSRQYAVMGTLLVQVCCHTSLALQSLQTPNQVVVKVYLQCSVPKVVANV